MSKKAWVFDALPLLDQREDEPRPDDADTRLVPDRPSAEASNLMPCISAVPPAYVLCQAIDRPGNARPYPKSTGTLVRLDLESRKDRASPTQRRRRGHYRRRRWTSRSCQPAHVRKQIGADTSPYHLPLSTQARDRRCRGNVASCPHHTSTTLFPKSLLLTSWKPSHCACCRTRDLFPVPCFARHPRPLSCFIHPLSMPPYGAALRH